MLREQQQVIEADDAVAGEVAAGPLLAGEVVVLGEHQEVVEVHAPVAVGVAGLVMDLADDGHVVVGVGVVGATEPEQRPFRALPVGDDRPDVVDGRVGGDGRPGPRHAVVGGDALVDFVLARADGCAGGGVDIRGDEERIRIVRVERDESGVVVLCGVEVVARVRERVRLPGRAVEAGVVVLERRDAVDDLADREGHERVAGGFVDLDVGGPAAVVAVAGIDLGEARGGDGGHTRRVHRAQQRASGVVHVPALEVPGVDRVAIVARVVVGDLEPDPVDLVRGVARVRPSAAVGVVPDDVPVAVGEGVAGVVGVGVIRVVADRAGETVGASFGRQVVEVAVGVAEVVVGIDVERPLRAEAGEVGGGVRDPPAEQVVASVLLVGDQQLPIRPDEEGRVVVIVPLERGREDRLGGRLRGAVP
jgi:hypothetical protein